MGAAQPASDDAARLGPDPDEGLARSAAGGDANAFEELVRRHAGLVLGLGIRVLGSRADAEALLQDVFMKIHGALPSFRGESTFKTWVARVTLNAARNRKRDEGRRLRLVTSLDAPLKGDENSTLADRISDGAPSPERQALSMDARARIERALARLPEEFRVVLILREIEGLSYDEIALALEIQPGTVKSRLARARGRLQEELADLVDRGDSP